MVDGRNKTALHLRLRNNNTGQLGNGFDHEDLGKAAGSGHTGVGHRSCALLQFNNPVEQQKWIAVGQICGRIGIKQSRLR